MFQATEWTESENDHLGWFCWFQGRDIPCGIIKSPDGRFSLWRSGASRQDSIRGIPRFFMHEPPPGSELVLDNDFEGELQRVSWWRKLHPEDYQIEGHEIETSCGHETKSHGHTSKEETGRCSHGEKQIQEG